MSVLPQPPTDEQTGWLADELERVAHEAVADRGMHPWTVAMAVLAFAREFRVQAILHAGLVGEDALLGRGGDGR